jgi:hypothetical protein
MMPGSIEDPRVAVAISEMSGSIKQLTEAVGLRLGHVERDLSRVDVKASAAHERLDVTQERLRGELSSRIGALQTTVKELDGTVEELEHWKERVVGFSLGLGALGGGVGGLIATLLSKAVQGG